MKEKEILEGNRLIAEFMGIDFSSKETFNKYSISILNASGFYHKSWDWLMPVVEKIDQYGASVIIGRMFCDIKYINPIKTEQEFDVRIASGVKMNAINGAIVEFIKWYNKQQS